MLLLHNTNNDTPNFFRFNNEIKIWVFTPFYWQRESLINRVSKFLLSGIDIPFFMSQDYTLLTL